MCAQEMDVWLMDGWMDFKNKIVEGNMTIGYEIESHILWEVFLEGEKVYPVHNYWISELQF